NNAADYGMNKWDDNDEERIYGDSVLKLSEESLTLTTTVTLKEVKKEVKVVYVKGLSLLTQ
ncbi:MAG: hypothetical protein LBJ36_01495, partial [Synergistaceae bacterium]|nr:hypothetical protein [Synergistaceae bacterium]